MRKMKFTGVVLGAALGMATAGAQAVTPFETDVATSIDDGLAWLD